MPSVTAVKLTETVFHGLVHSQLRWNQAHVVSERAQLASPVVRAACLHRDQARFQIGKPGRKSLPCARFLYHDSLGAVDRMNLHDVLR
ncbi:hypothetical protein AWB74_08663 [Caballeronia arvi]|uniref:Uncharacterized protein n=1 Tax=Caballeronia arvi TaxID=1777135 RepID=A0A158L5L3_9BURK|nr:hypothetical protein AWB74_08663 [Caballeronia arvi]